MSTRRLRPLITPWGTKKRRTWHPGDDLNDANMYTFGASNDMELLNLIEKSGVIKVFRKKFNKEVPKKPSKFK